MSYNNKNQIISSQSLNNPLRYTDPTGYDVGDGSASQIITPVSVFNPPKSIAPTVSALKEFDYTQMTTIDTSLSDSYFSENITNAMEDKSKSSESGGFWGLVSKSISYVGGLLQVATGVTMMATIGWTGVGFYAGATMVGLGANNIQSTWTGDTTVKDFINKTTGCKYAYAALDVGTSLTSLTRAVGVKSVQYLSRGLGEIEMTRHAYAYEKMTTAMVVFEVANDYNTLKNSGD